MKTKNKIRPFDSEPDLIFRGTKIAWPKTKEENWAELIQKIEKHKADKVPVIRLTYRRLAIAASIMLLIGLSATLTLYTKTFENPAGRHALVNLPDKSVVTLNAQTVISYKPLLWNIHRKVHLEGEAFFEVKKGKKFEVVSGMGKTEVLGTKFNVYSRNNVYQVSCISGSVRVKNSSGTSEAVLAPEQKAEITTNGSVAVKTVASVRNEISWTENMFFFTGESLLKVFEEIERQFDVKIIVTCPLEKRYSGNFNKGTHVEDALKIVCKPYNLNFTRKSENEYSISECN